MLQKLYLPNLALLARYDSQLWYNLLFVFISSVASLIYTFFPACSSIHERELFHLSAPLNLSYDVSNLKEGECVCLKVTGSSHRVTN